MLKITESDNPEKLKGIISDKNLSQIRIDRHLCVETKNGYLISFRFCDMGKMNEKDDLVVVFMHDSDILFMTKNKYVLKLIKGLDKKESAALLLYDFFDAISSNDIYELESREDSITDLEDTLLTQTTSNKEELEKIVVIRRDLLKIKRYYEQLGMITDMLCADKSNIFDPELQSKFTIIDKRIDKLLETVVTLREYVTQVREAYQSQIDIEQNNIMRIFTVIATIFLPLTLIVGWYGMNFRIPELEWDYGYIFVIALCVAVCVINLIWFKKKKWF